MSNNFTSIGDFSEIGMGGVGKIIFTHFGYKIDRTAMYFDFGNECIGRNKVDFQHYHL